MTRPALRRRRRNEERGTATAFVVGFAVVLLACAGLVIDGGTALNARMKLADDVEQAARAGAQEIDVAYLRESDQVRLNPSAAQARAGGYLAGIGYSNFNAQVVPDVNGAPNSVQVAARDTVPTTMLKMIGISSFDIEASATAQAVTQ